MPRRKSPQPADPMIAMVRSAELRARERAAANDPGNWGVDPTIKTLPSSRAVKVTRGPRARIIAAHRQDAFDALHSRDGLSDGQHQAARRLIRDWAEMLGLGGAADLPIIVAIDGNSGDQELVNDRMINARRRVEGVMGAPGRNGRPPIPPGVGRGSAQLLAALVEPIVLDGVVTWWRGRVQKVTQEQDPTAQAAHVRAACENLRLHYGLGDAANDNRPGRIHPFHPAC